MALELKDESASWTVKDSEVLTGGDPTVEYTIKRLTLDKHREIRRKHTKQATYRKPERVSEEDFQDDLFDYVLVGWKNVVGSGQPLPCDWQHKRLIDTARRVSLLDMAGLNEIAASGDARDESFRPDSDVR